MNKHTMRMFVLVALFLAVPLGLAFVLPAPSSDTRELLSWGLNPGFSTPKQPPLMQWVGFVIMHWAWPTTFWCVLLTQILNAVGLFYAYATSRLFMPKPQAELTLVLLAGSLYILAAPVPFALNADILQFPFWAATLFYVLKQPLNILGLALAFALAFYAKYTVLLLALSLALASLIVPPYRQLWRERRLYLAALCILLLVLPHLWVLPQSGAFHHASGVRAASFNLPLRLGNLLSMLEGFFLYLTPAWLILGVSLWRREWVWKPAPVPEARFIRTTAGVALGLLALLILGFGFKYPSRYDSPFLFVILLAGMSGVHPVPERFEGMRRGMRFASAGFAVLVLSVGMLTYGVFATHPRQQEPLRETAALLHRQWQSRFACGPAYIMGDLWSSYGLGIASVPPVPGVHLLEMQNVPGYDPQRADDLGVMIIYRAPMPRGEVAAVFPHLDLSAPQSLSMPFSSTYSLAYEYIFVPPKHCGV